MLSAATERNRHLFKARAERKHSSEESNAPPLSCDGINPLYLVAMLVLLNINIATALFSQTQSHALPVAAAFGAVAIAAVGVWGVFKMAMAVAEGTGRTLNSHGASYSATAPASQSPANGLLPMQPDVPSGTLYPPVPAARKVRLEAS